MRFNLVALLAFLPVAFAQRHRGDLVAITKEICTTKFAHHPVRPPIPTHSTTTTVATFTRTERTVVTPTITITKKGPTITRLSFCATVTTTISLPHSWRTWSRTHTHTRLTTVTSTSTSILTYNTQITTTTGDGTTTVPPPAHFTPAGPSGGSVHPRAEEVAQVEERQPQNRYPRPTFPVAVFCTEKVKIFTSTTVTKTSHHTVTRYVHGRPSFTTKCLTSTSTVIKSHVPHTRHHDTTTTLTATESAFATTTTTLTSTVTTSAMPTATYYAACGPDNALSTLPNGKPITDVNFLTPDYNIFGVSAVSQYDCCVQCITSPICDIAFYTLHADRCAPAGRCYQINQNGVCPQQNPFVEAVYNPFCPGTIAVSNGPCGQIKT